MAEQSVTPIAGKTFGVTIDHLYKSFDGVPVLDTSGRPLGSLMASLTLPELVIHSSNCPAEVGVD